VAKIVLAAQLARWLPADGGERETAWQCAGDSVREVLDALFVQCPTLRGYVLDERGKIRRHVAVFVDGTALSHHSDLGEPLGGHAEVHVLQALSGG
jgi:molybdopterin synthase sulfur carrier subunit